MVSRSFTVSFIGISSSSPLVLHFLCNTRTSLIFSHVFCFRYIYHELIPKEALSASFLPVYVEEWVLDSSPNFMYTDEHDVYPFAHLKHAGWYLDCSKGFVPPSEVHLFTSLNAEAPADVVFHEPVVPEESVKGTKASKVVKEIKSKKVKAVSGTQASQATMSTRSATKAAAEASAAPAATFVGSPSLPLALHAPAPSHSTATAPSLTRKRKAFAAATSATSSETASTYSLIENVDIGVLMDHYTKTNSHQAAYLRIEEFLVKVGVHFFFHSCIHFYLVKHSSSLLNLLLCSTGWCRSDSP